MWRAACDQTLVPEANNEKRCLARLDIGRPQPGQGSSPGQYFGAFVRWLK
jgi:hypothetical protein